MTLNHNSYLYYSQLLVIATLPFHFLASSYAIILSLLLLIFKSIESAKFREDIIISFKKNKITQLILLFFILYILSSIIHFSDYSTISFGLSSLEQRLSFLIFPFLMAPFSFYTNNRIKWVFITFVGSLFASCIIALSSGTVQTILTGSLYYFDKDTGVLFNNFMYHRLGSFVGIHAVYFAEYVLLAFIIWVSFSYYNFAKWSFKYKFISVLLGMFFITIIFLLKSAAILIILLTTISLFTFYYLYKAKEQISRSMKIMIVSIGVILVSALSIRAIDKIGSKANFFSYDLSQPGGGDWNAINLRLAKWEVAKMAITDHWLWGVGPGNTGIILDSYYKKVGFNYALQLHYNPHNQYLHTFLTLGIIGIALLVLIFGLSIRQSINKKDSVMFLFIISFILFSMSESTLAVNKGIVFFSVFLSFFSYLPNKSSYYLNATSDQS